MKTKRETLIKPNATADKRIRMKLKKTKKKNQTGTNKQNNGEKHA